MGLTYKVLFPSISTFENTTEVSMTNRAMTLFTSLGPSADCRGLT